MLSEIDILSTYLPMDRVQAIARSEDLPSHAQGTALFADVSGFTPLTEALSRQFGPRRGAEELTHLLNQFFHALISEVHRHNGNVIGFSGDAMTCWFDDDDSHSSARRATACGLAMQSSTQSFAQVSLQSRPSITLTIKVSIATGSARRFVVGDPSIQLLDVLAGATLTRMAVGEHIARQGEVIADAPTITTLTLADIVDITEWRSDEKTGERFAVIANLPFVFPTWEKNNNTESLTADQLRPWLLPMIYERIRSGQGEFVTELRMAVALFVRFDGIHYDEDELAGEKLNIFIYHVQNTLAKYEGTLLALTTGDKGSYLHAAFGALLAHEDDARRAVLTARELQNIPPGLHFNYPVQIGIARGGMRAGSYGGEQRRTYDVMGDDVNLAARLMQAAAPGEILANEALMDAAGEACTWEVLEPLSLKGKTQPIAIFRLAGEITQQNAQPRPLTGRMVGRVIERGQLASQMQALTRGQSGLCIIEGEAGIGKSRLVVDLQENALHTNVLHLSGAGDAIEKSTPYHAWRSVFTQLLKWDSPTTTTELNARRMQVQELLPPGMVERAPLLNVVLSLDWHENELTSQMSGEVRADNTRELLLALLQQAAAESPLLLILDDAHWFDSASWTLALAVNQRVNPVLLVIVTRPLSPPLPDEYARLRGQPHSSLLSLDALPQADILTLICLRLGVTALPDPVVTLIHNKAEGHPFFSEELAYALRDSGIITVDRGECRIAHGADFNSVTVPDTVEGVITSRIDRLASSSQLALKVASIIGRIFAFRLLHDVHPVETDKPQLAGILNALQKLDLTPLDSPEPDLTYIFKHIITREVAYNLMTFAQRRELHRAVGEWYEHAYASDPTPHYPILAYHWSKTDDPAKAITYLEKAGEQALAQYANQEALNFLSEAAHLADGVQPPISTLRRARWERQMGEACLKLGRHMETREHSQNVLALLGRSLPKGRIRQFVGLLRQVTREAGRRIITRDVVHFGGINPVNSSEASVARLEVARAYFNLGELAYYENDVISGLTLMIGIVDLLEGDEPSPELTNAYAGLGIVASHIGRPGWAEMYGRLAQATAKRLGSAETEAFVLQVKALSKLRLHQWEDVHLPASEASLRFSRLGDRRRWEECLEYIGYVAMLRGEFTKGIEVFLEKAASARQRNDANSALMALWYLIRMQFILGKTQESLDSIQAGFGLTEYSSDPKFEMFLWAALTQAHLRRNDKGALERAREALERGKRLADEPSSTLISGVASCILAQSAVDFWNACGQPETERLSLARFLKQCNINALLDWRPGTLPQRKRLQGWEAWISGNPDKACRLWHKSLTIAEKLKIPYEAGLAHSLLGQYAAGKDRQVYKGQAIEIFERLDAVYDLEQARQAIED